MTSCFLNVASTDYKSKPNWLDITSFCESFNHFSRIIAFMAANCSSFSWLTISSLSASSRSCLKPEKIWIKLKKLWFNFLSLKPRLATATIALQTYKKGHLSVLFFISSFLIFFGKNCYTLCRKLYFQESKVQNFGLKCCYFGVLNTWSGKKHTASGAFYFSCHPRNLEKATRLTD